MFCPTCGTQLTGDARFCPTCGSPVEGEGAASPSPAGPVAPAPAPAFVPARPAAPTAYRSATPAAPARQKKPRKKIVMAVAAVVALALVAGGAFAAYNVFVASNANDGNQEETEQVVGQDDDNRAELDQARYQLYYDKCREYLDKYGEPGYETIINSRYSDGFIFAKLLDLDGDGIDELVLGRREGGLDEIRTSLDVWTFDSESKTINLVTTNDDQPQLMTDDECTYINFIEANGSIYVEERPGSHYEALPVGNYTPEFKTLKDGSFVADDSFKRESSHYTFDGKDCPVSETTYYLGPEDGNFANRDHAVAPKDTLATVHQTIDQLKQLSGNTDPEEQEAAQQPQQEPEQPVEPAQEPITYSFTIDEVAANVPVDPGKESWKRRNASWRYSRIIPSTQSDAVDKINATIRSAMESSAAWTNSLPTTTEELREYGKSIGTTPYFITSREIFISYIDDNYVCYLDSGTTANPYDYQKLQGLCFSLKTGEPVTPYEVLGITEEQLVENAKSGVAEYLSRPYGKHSLGEDEIIGNIPTSITFSDHISSICPVSSVPGTHYLINKYGIDYLTDQYAMGSDQKDTHQIVIIPTEVGFSVGSDQQERLANPMQEA